MEKNRRREGEWRQRAEAVGFHRPWLAEVCGAGTWREQAGGRYGLVVMLFDNGGVWIELAGGSCCSLL